jgi:MFS family permease
LPVSRDWVRVFLAMAAVAWGANQFAPLIQLYRVRDHLSATGVMAIFAAYALGVIPALLAAGPYVRRRRLHGAVRCGAVLSLAGTLVMLVGAAYPVMLYPGRFVIGLSAGAAFGAGSAWLNVLSAGATDDADVGARRATVALSLGFGAGPLVAGGAAQWLPAPTVVPYLLHTGLISSAILRLWRCQEPDNELRGGRTAQALVPSPARTKRFLLGVVPWAPWVFGTATIGFTVLPVLVADRMRAPIAFSGLVAGLVLAAGVAVQPLARRLGRGGGPRARSAGLSAAALGLAGGAAVACTRNLVLALAVALVLGASYGVLLVSGLVEVEHLAAPDELAGLTAIFYTMTYVGVGFPLILAACAGAYGYTTALLAAALLPLVTLPLTAAATKRKRPPQSAPAGIGGATVEHAAHRQAAPTAIASPVQSPTMPATSAGADCTASRRPR